MTKRTIRTWATSCVLAFIFAVSTAQAKDGSPELERLADLMAHRLYLMEGVAAYKHINQRAVADPAREAIVIEGGQRVAARAGLDEQAAKELVIAQMEAAKEIQSRLIKGWQEDAASAPTSAPDLGRELRPAISLVTTRILEQLALVLPLLKEKQNRSLFWADLAEKTHSLQLSNDTLTALVNGAASVTYRSAQEHSLLDEILMRGTLRVGTTGDYAPFSTKTETGYGGIDISLAEDLAKTLGVEIKFVETSWPTLMDDFNADKFDIGMSGISRTLERAKRAYFSAPYHKGGKTPIARCKDIEKFDTLAEIDEPTVRVVVNPGGTNEKYTRGNIEEAQIEIIDDNTKVFAEIAENRADVMITDAIEVAFQSARDERLCGTMGDQTLTVSEKGFLLPRDEVWRSYVDAWLHTKKQNGSLATTFDAHIKSTAHAN